jgi:hypothetical protein
MDALENEAPPSCGLTKDSKLGGEARAARIFGCLMHMAPFKAALDWLYEALTALPEREHGAVSALFEINRYLIPWLFVAGHSGQFAELEKVNLGGIVALPLGLHCFAEIVSAGLTHRAAELLGGANPRGANAISSPPLSGLEADIEAQLRNELFSKLGVVSEFSNADSATKDERINERLEFCMNGPKKTRFYFTFFIHDYGDQTLLAKIADRYPVLAIIRLDGRLSRIHDSWWLKMAAVLGYKT